jgi:outer membrane lipopolysaccharide assembly protein LptE/RlpB
MLTYNEFKDMVYDELAFNELDITSLTQEQIASYYRILDESWGKLVIGVMDSAMREAGL